MDNSRIIKIIIIKMKNQNTAEASVDLNSEETHSFKFYKNERLEETILDVSKTESLQFIKCFPNTIDALYIIRDFKLKPTFHYDKV